MQNLLKWKAEKNVCVTNMVTCNQYFSIVPFKKPIKRHNYLWLQETAKHDFKAFEFF